MQQEKVKCVFSAHATGNGDGPDFAVVECGQSFIDRLLHLGALAKDQSLSELREYRTVDEWGPGEVEDDLRLVMAEMVVAGGDFWFSDHPKQTDYDIETRSVAIGDFIKAVVNHRGRQPLYFGEDVKALESRFLESVGEHDGDTENLFSTEIDDLCESINISTAHAVHPPGCGLICGQERGER